MPGDQRVVPIYTTSGMVGAFMVYPLLYNPRGEWIGWVTPDRQVYSVHGNYAGYLSDDPRILRNRNAGFRRPRLNPPSPPGPIRPPATVPLAPMMRELSFSEIDVLEEDPQSLPTRDSGELREDMD